MAGNHQRFQYIPRRQELHHGEYHIFIVSEPKAKKPINREMGINDFGTSQEDNFNRWYVHHGEDHMFIISESKAKKPTYHIFF